MTAERRPDIQDAVSLFGATPMQGIQSAVLFAGGGGSCIGIKRAVGLSPFLAVNHSPAAIEMHAANHPDTIHLCENIREVKPREAVRGRRVDVLWASPDCTHFSVARGGKPKSKEIRGLAWMVCRWAKEVAPPIIFMENVWELTTWSPLTCRRRRKNWQHRKPSEWHRGGTPIKAKAGETFRLFVGHLQALGYAVEWRKLPACAYGTPTTRERLYLIARNDGQAIVWPAPTHGDPKSPEVQRGELRPWRTAAECINFEIPMLSIFATPEEAKAWAKANGRKGVPKRPLAPATLRRIAEGVKRYVLESAEPYIVRIGHQSSDAGKVHPTGDPLSTVTTKNEHLLVAPELLCLTHGQRIEPIDEPMRTVTAAHRGERAVIAPTLVRYQGQRREGEPGRTAHVAEPLPTITTEPRFGLVAASLINTRNGEREGQAPRTHDIAAPYPTVTAQGSQGAVVTAFLAQHNGGEKGHQAIGQDLRQPMSTVAGNINKAACAVFLDKMYGSASAGQPVDAPAPTVTAGGGRAALVAALIVAYYGSETGQHQALSEPMHTIVSKARFGLVTVTIGGQEYAIVDIAMRMLTSRELATANGFPDDYLLTGTEAERIERIGNAVCPQMAEALVGANVRRPAPERRRRPSRRGGDALAAK
jgi:DNA (cytosine-5)-methyltransferase 1